MRTTTAALFAIPLLVAATPAAHGDGHNHAVHHRALQVEVVTVTTVVYHTVTAAEEPIPQKETPAAAPPIAPPNTPSTFSGNPYKLLVPVAGSASVMNSCDYPVYVWSVGDPSCGPGAQRELIASNTTYTEKMRKCNNSGISLKVSKSQSATTPMQFEYTVWDNEDKVSYDISYLDCMKNVHGEKDLSACVGHERGIQAVAGTADDAGCPDYHCMPNEWCDQQAYVVAEFDYQPGAPVGACGVDKGVAFELCAGNR